MVLFSSGLLQGDSEHFYRPRISAYSVYVSVFAERQILFSTAIVAIYVNLSL